MEIINEINEHFLAELKTKTRDKAKIERMRIVTDEENPKVRMAYLATAGGSHVNGVAELHSELLKDVTLRDFSDLYGDKFTNVTNGVTPVASSASPTRACPPSSPKASAPTSG